MIKIFYPHHPSISFSIKRVRDAFLRYLPDDFIIVRRPEEDAIQIIDYIGQHPRAKNANVLLSVPFPLTKKYVLIYHCHPLIDDLFSRNLITNAELVISTYRKEWLAYSEHINNFLRVCWGVDTLVFYPDLDGLRNKKYLVLSTGTVAESEYIDVFYRAVVKLNAKMCHIGNGDAYNKLMKISPYNFDEYEFVTDSTLRYLYSSSWFTNACREGIGFELPAIEGYACGSQPICLDLPCYRDWFNDFAIFIPANKEEAYEKLIDILSKPKYVFPKKEILERFSWKRIMGKIYEAIREISS